MKERVAGGGVEQRVTAHTGVEGHSRDFGDDKSPPPYADIIKGCDACETWDVVSAQ